MAEGEGFEPPLPFRVKRFSRPPVSTTHTSLRKWQVFTLAHCTTTSAFASPVVVCILTPAETPSLSNSADLPHRVHSFIGFAKRWGWPGVAAQVHFWKSYSPRRRCWGWPGVAAQVHSKRRHARLPRCWGWPGVAAQVHFMHVFPWHDFAGDGRESLLKYTYQTELRPATQAGDGRESLLKYTLHICFIWGRLAGDGRESGQGDWILRKA